MKKAKKTSLIAVILTMVLYFIFDGQIASAQKAKPSLAELMAQKNKSKAKTDSLTFRHLFATDVANLIKFGTFDSTMQIYFDASSTYSRTKKDPDVVRTNENGDLVYTLGATPILYFQNHLQVTFVKGDIKAFYIRTKTDTILFTMQPDSMYKVADSVYTRGLWYGKDKSDVAPRLAVRKILPNFKEQEIVQGNKVNNIKKPNSEPKVDDDRPTPVSTPPAYSAKEY